MSADKKTQLIAGGLGAAILAVLGYGLYLKRAASIQAPAPAASASAVPKDTSAPPLVQGLSVETESTVSGNSQGHSATLKGAAGWGLAWTIQGGSIESDPNRESITWSAGNLGEAVLLCTCTSPDGLTVNKAQAKVTVIQAPLIDRFEAASAILTEGKSTRLGWNAQHAKTLRLDPGGQDVSAVSGPGFEVSPAKTTAFTLTATNSLGVSVSRELTVKVVPAAEFLGMRAEPVAGSDGDYTVIGEFRNGKAELKDGAQVLASAETSPLSLRVSTRPGQVFTLNITNPAGTFISSSLQIPVAAPKPAPAPARR